MAKAFRVQCTEQARQDIRTVADALGIKESEVLRRGLIVMGLYAQHVKNLGDGRRAIIVDGKIIYLQ